jgi:hypothetical protein
MPGRVATELRGGQGTEPGRRMAFCREISRVRRSLPQPKETCAHFARNVVASFRIGVA